MSKSSSELHQRAIPKHSRVPNLVDERDDGIERQVQRVPAFDPVAPESAAPDLPSVKPLSQDVAAGTSRLPGRTASPAETPHVQVETEEAKQARLDRQWKQLKVDVAELPGVYSRLSKIKLTGERS